MNVCISIYIIIVIIIFINTRFMSSKNVKVTHTKEKILTLFFIIFIYFLYSF